MKIEKNTAVTLRLQVSDAASGRLLDAGREPMVYLHGGYGGIFPKIEAALEGREPLFRVSVDLAPQDAFGERDERLVQTIAKHQFPPGVKVGGQLQGPAEDGRVIAFTVMKIKGDKVLLDGNHPLAGRTLRCRIEIRDVRAATPEEIAHGHVHGAHGHQH
ncbi:MAG: FKBP-type peptidyl-prolyl cis-trans isomerase SlyD [Burkholderiaceae bacterium]|jgi:FKBP-type peptidyl-prolyl cis-trans isomerase SlyD|nr:MAG: FKBP-type peptidyl-prolyl cis-trans isomerase SlyD [Burkholderiaceae bacterium]